MPRCGRGSLAATGLACAMIAARAMAAEEEEENSPEDIAIAIMLVGSISFQLGLFYLINWPDEDIQEASWNVIGCTVSIFAAVLFFQGVKGMVEAAFGDSLIVSFIQMLVWFGLMQMACGFFSGAFYEKATAGQKDLYWFDAKAQMKRELRKQLVKSKQEAAAKSGDGWVSSVPTGEIQAKTSLHRLTIKEDEELNRLEDVEEDKHLLKKVIHKYREGNLKCFAEILAHMTGFAAISFFASLQQVWIFGHSWIGSYLIVPISACTMVLIFRSTDHIRQKKSLEDGTISKQEEAWDEETEEAENDVVGLAVAFVTVNATRFLISGRLPNEEGVVERGDDPVAELWCTVATFICMIATILYFVKHVRRTKIKEWAWARVRFVSRGFKRAEKPHESDKLADNVRICESGELKNHFHKYLCPITKQDKRLREGGKTGAIKEFNIANGMVQLNTKGWFPAESLTMLEGFIPDKKKEPEKHQEYKEDVKSFFTEEFGRKARFLCMFENYFVMVISWTLLFGCKDILALTGIAGPETITGKVMLAIVLSWVVFGMIFVLDSLSDEEEEGSDTDKVIQYLIRAMGMLIGFSWEASFDLATEAIAEPLGDGAVFGKFLISLVLCAITIPAYRAYILPEVMAREQEEEEEDDEEEDAKEPTPGAGSDAQTALLKRDECQTQ